jgi:3-phenylpropionate/cinnamic acid dioxygenase small subunit
MNERDEARLQRLEDLMEIHQLFIDYGMHLDAGDFEAYSSLFASDGEVMMGPLGRATGPAAIKELMVKAIGDKVGSTFHVISSPMVQLDGDHAASKVMWTVVNRDENNHAVLMAIGHHRDELVRENGRWRFKKRRGYFDIPSTMPK